MQITATTSAEADINTHAMVMVTSLSATQGKSAYPTMRTTFNFIVNPAICDCKLLDWDIPTKVTLATKVSKTPTQTLAMATINEASKTAVPAIRVCPWTACDVTSTLTLVEKNTASLPAFVTFNVDPTSRLLSVSPTISGQMTSVAKPQYTLTMTQATRNGDGNLVWDAIDITVGCLIERIDTPTKPADVTYNILAAANKFTLTPAFLQWPPCDYPITHSLAW